MNTINEGTAMFRRFTLLLALLTVACLSFGNQATQGQSISYSGSITNNGIPVNNGFVIIGTFNPSFDPLFNIEFEFGYGDPSGNYCTCQSNYSRGVSNGLFTPIGSGTFTTSTGTFVGSGLNLSGSGRQLFMWAFDTPNPDTANVLAVATSPSWITGSNPLLLTTDQATSFVFGGKNGSAIALQYHLDIPEPGCCTLVGLILPSLGFRRRRALVHR